MGSLMPVRKVLAGFVAAGITWLALRAGVDLGASGANEAATALVGYLVSWLVPDAS